MRAIETPDVRGTNEASVVDHPDRDGRTRQRQRFIRRCGYVGTTLIVVGLAGLARDTLTALGGLVLVLGVLAWIIDLEPPPVDTNDTNDTHDAADRPADDLTSEALAPPPQPVATDDPRPVQLPVPSPPPDGGWEPAAELEPAPRRLPVRFRLPAEVGATTVHVAGDFNGWSQVDDPLVLVGDHWETVVMLESGSTHRYRYVLDGHRWENDWHADDYLVNDFGTTDSVLRVPGEPTTMET